MPKIVFLTCTCFGVFWCIPCWPLPQLLIESISSQYICCLTLIWMLVHYWVTLKMFLGQHLNTGQSTVRGTKKRYNFWKVRVMCLLTLTCKGVSKIDSDSAMHSTTCMNDSKKHKKKSCIAMLMTCSLVRWWPVTIHRNHVDPPTFLTPS